MYVTIVTPTYNRGETLKNLYESLLEQTCKDFKWLIVDDGSIDNTENIVGSFIKENKVNIQYIKKINGGKHTALNYGIKEVNTDLVFIVDSDDWLTKDAIKKIGDTHSKYKLNDDICGYSFLRAFSNGNINGKILEEDEVIESYINVRIKGKDTNSDKAEVWKTKNLREYPFPEFENEKFLGEDVVWVKLAFKYKMVFLKQVIYISEYLDDGLTKNRRINNIKSPKGCYCRAEIILEACKKFNIKDVKYLFKCMIQYQVYSRFAKLNTGNVFANCKYKFLFIIMWFPSVCVYNLWRKKYLREDK